MYPPFPLVDCCLRGATERVCAPGGVSSRAQHGRGRGENTQTRGAAAASVEAGRIGRAQACPSRLGRMRAALDGGSGARGAERPALSAVYGAAKPDGGGNDEGDGTGIPGIGGGSRRKNRRGGGARPQEVCEGFSERQSVQVVFFFCPSTDAWIQI